MNKFLPLLLTLFICGCATVEKKNVSNEGLGPIRMEFTSSPSFTGQYYEIEELDIKPEATKMVAPLYPPKLKSKKIDGIADCCFIIDVKGNVTQLQVEYATSKEFAESAIRALKKWKFSPGLKDGIKVNTLVKIPLGFRIGGDKS